MIFDGQFAVGFLYLFVRSTSFNAQDFVVIALRHSLGRRFFGDDDTGRAKQSILQFVSFA